MSSDDFVAGLFVYFVLGRSWWMGMGMKRRFVDIWTAFISVYLRPKHVCLFAFDLVYLDYLLI